MSDADYWCAVVMPCLNEQDNLVTACRSLGFGGAQQTPERCFLVLVDNGSTDATFDVSQMLRSEVGDMLSIIREPLRGHVPARHRGNLTAAQLAEMRGVPPTEVVIIQADADTRYSSGYVDKVREAISIASASSPMGQAVTLFPPDFKTAYPGVFAKVDAVDQAVEQRFGFSRYDVVVDDKACAYRLSDYERWGGHRREYFRDGSELLAETTRLTIAGLARGAERIDIADASVVHSQRRLLCDAAQELAAAGFPYSGRRVLPGSATVTFNELERNVIVGDRELLDAISVVRAAHLVALMVLLPAHVARTLADELPADPAVRVILETLPRRSFSEAATAPGRLLGDVLDLIPADGSLLDHLGISW